MQGTSLSPASFAPRSRRSPAISSYTAPTRRTGLHRRPKGRYLLAYYQGPWQGLPAKYEAILAYARDHELTLTGFAYEKGVNELVIQQDEDYITQIEIPVQDPCSDGSSPRSHRTT